MHRKILIVLAACLTMETAHAQTPPVAKKVPHVLEIHGRTLEDPYFWLRQKDDPDVKKYLEAENDYTTEVMKPTEAFRKDLYDECLARIKETDERPPYPKGDYVYFARTEKGKQYPIYCRAPKAHREQVATILDVNQLAVGQPFMAVGTLRVSDDGNILAYSVDNTGYRQYTLHFKDLRTGQEVGHTFPRVGSLVWCLDNKTVFFTTEDEVSKRSDKFWRYALGEAEPTLVFEEKDELFDIGCHRSREGKMLFLHSAAKTSSEDRYARADAPNDWKVFRPREAEHEYDIDHRGQLFYIRTNKGATNFRLCTAPEDHPEQWTDLVAHDPQTKLEGIELFRDFSVVAERRAGNQEMMVLPASGERYQLPVPEPVHSLDFEVNEEFGATTLRYEYESPITPRTIFEFDPNTRKSVVLKQDEVLGDFKREDYGCQRVEVPARDGTRIPISVVYRKDLPPGSQTPLVLYGYGSYGVSYDPSFSSNRISLLKRGVTFAIAHIRGGGELGEPWRQAGRMMKKMTTFTDFIDCADGLVKQKVAAPDKIVITGGSAGGLLMGAVSNMRPDLFRAVVSKVPFVDVMNTMLDASLPLTTSEYTEWGNPQEKPAFDYMIQYSPYDNVKTQSYPPMLVEVSYYDSQVPYWEGAKLVARLRERKTDKNTILLKTNFSAGHGGASGRYDYLHEVAFDYAYMLWQLGVWQPKE